MIERGGGHVCDERERERERERKRREKEARERERERARGKSIATHRYSHTSFTHPPQTSQLKCRLHNSKNSSACDLSVIF